MDAKQLLKYALDKMTPTQASNLLENSDIVFGIQGTYAKFENGSLRTRTGETVSGGIGAITSVKTTDELRAKGLDREPTEEEKTQAAVDAARLGRANTDLSETHSLPGSGLAPRTVSPIRGEPGAYVVGGATTGDDHSRHDNIATNGMATAGHTVPTEAVQEAEANQASVGEGDNAEGDVGEAVSPEEAKRLADQARNG